jgi:hypothetical protein
VTAAITRDFLNQSTLAATVVLATRGSVAHVHYQAGRVAAELQASEQTLMAISGHVSRKMIEHYSHIRIDAKRTATEAIVDGGVNQNVNQLTVDDSRTSVRSLN